MTCTDLCCLKFINNIKDIRQKRRHKSSYQLLINSIQTVCRAGTKLMLFTKATITKKQKPPSLKNKTFPSV